MKDPGKLKKWNKNTYSNKFNRINNNQPGKTPYYLLNIDTNKIKDKMTPQNPKA